MKSLATVFLSLVTFCATISQNLIANSGFEINGQLNCASWYDACHQELSYLCDTLQPGNPCDIAFYKDTPPGGGTWSLGATGIGNSFPSTASTYITGQSGTNHYRLQAWMKDAGQAFGGINIVIRSKGENIFHKSVAADSTDWAFYAVPDTLTLQPGDSIQITLSAFAAGPAFGDIFFDEVKYILLDSLSSTHIEQLPKHSVSVFPNPVTNDITLDIRDPNEEHLISIYTLTGQLVQQLLTLDQQVTVDMRAWESGLYFYRIERSKESLVIGQGKIIRQ